MNLDVKKTVLLILMSFVTSSNFAQNWDRHAVYLGEKNYNNVVEEKRNNCSVITIRLDGEGNYYPNIFIEDKSMKKSKGKLKLWYEKNPNEYQIILNEHQIENNNTALRLLNESIERKFIQLIDKASAEKEIIFIVHGYRKQMYKQKDNSLSMKENDVVERYLGSDKLFVEIYWDSRHITLLKGIVDKKILKMMEASAIPNAKKVGTQLRTLVSSLQKSKLTIISHSLGSVVANEISFNYDKESTLMEGKQLSMVYLAPAIGHESFAKANQRGLGDYKLKTYIAYNNNDFVLNKDFSKFGIKIDSNAKTYGNTSLGCDFEDDVLKLNQLYRTQMPDEEIPTIINMSGRINHNFSYYVKHPMFSEIMKEVFGQMN